MDNDTVYTYYRLDFINCNLDYDYTIVPSIEDIEDYLIAVDIDLDDPYSDACVKITGIGMTKNQYDEFIQLFEP